MIIQGEKEPRACWVITASKRKRCAKKSEQPRETSAKGQQKIMDLIRLWLSFFSLHREKAKKKIDNLKRTLNQPSLSLKLLSFFYLCFANLKMIRKKIDYNDRARISRKTFQNSEFFTNKQISFHPTNNFIDFHPYKTHNFLVFSFLFVFTSSSHSFFPTPNRFFLYHNQNIARTQTHLQHRNSRCDGIFSHLYITI